MGTDIRCCRQEQPVPMLSGLTEHSVQVLNPGANPAQHVAALHSALRAGEDSGVEALADLLHPHPQLLPLIEDEEDALAKRVSAVGVHHLLLDVHEFDEHVALGDSPEHRLESQHPGSVQNSGSDVKLERRGGPLIGSIFDVGGGSRVIEKICCLVTCSCSAPSVLLELVELVLSEEAVSLGQHGLHLPQVLLDRFQTCLQLDHFSWSRSWPFHSVLLVDRHLFSYDLRLNIP